jgi:hypothetical protein
MLLEPNSLMRVAETSISNNKTNVKTQTQNMNNHF